MRTLLNFLFCGLLKWFIALRYQGYFTEEMKFTGARLQDTASIVQWCACLFLLHDDAVMNAV